jgi:hypothetical protein
MAPTVASARVRARIFERLERSGRARRLSDRGSRSLTR